MLRRIFALIVIAWASGFSWFAVSLPHPASARRSDAAVVLTGAGGRIERGLDALNRRWVGRMLVSGVDGDVKPREFAVEYEVSPTKMKCCVTLGFEAVDTRSNAREAAEWIEQNHVRSVRLVTSDWHMRRAAADLRAATGGKVEIIEDAVPSRPRLRMLFTEYHKLLARIPARALGM